MFWAGKHTGKHLHSTKVAQKRKENTKKEQYKSHIFENKNQK